MSLNKISTPVVPSKDWHGSRPIRSLSFLTKSSWLLALVVLLGLGHPTIGRGAATVPGVLSFQGYLEDAAGVGLGDSGPVNYPVVFRIYKAPTGGTLLWSEEQNVTFDKGNYSVLLGQGAAVTGEPHPNLSSVMVFTNGNQRYIQSTVTIDGAPPVTILPRLQLLPSPYAFLSTHALTAEAATTAVSASTAVSVTGNVAASQVTGKLTGSQLANNAVTTPKIADGSVTGWKIADGTITSAKIGGNVLLAAQIPALNTSKITSGRFGDARLPTNLARTSKANTFSGNQTINGNLTVANSLNVGSVGQYKVAAGEESLRIVRGQVKIINATPTPVRVRGTGFTPRRNTEFRPPGFGQIRAVTEIVFDPPFADVPTVTATLVSPYAEAGDTSLNYFSWIRVDSISSTNAMITSFHPANGGWIILAPFTFIAVGSR